RHLPEVRVRVGEGPQPRIFELARAPRVAELRAFAGKDFLRQRGDRPRIERRESVECYGLNGCHRGRLPRRIPDDGFSGCEGEKMAAIHFSVLLVQMNTRGCGRIEFSTGQDLKARGTIPSRAETAAYGPRKGSNPPLSAIQSETLTSSPRDADAGREMEGRRLCRTRNSPSVLRSNT